MASYYELKLRSDSQFMFNLRAGNHQIILTSVAYAAKAGAINGIESVRKHGVVDGNFLRKTGSDNQRYFVLQAANHEIIGTSEMYTDNRGMENGIRSVMANAQATEIREPG